jgi:hypothetical protein
MEGLTSEDTIKVVCQQLNVPSLPEVVAATVVQKSLGNPYFALELSRGIVESGGAVQVECSLTHSSKPRGFNR